MNSSNLFYYLLEIWNIVISASQQMQYVMMQLSIVFVSPPSLPLLCISLTQSHSDSLFKHSQLLHSHQNLLDHHIIINSSWQIWLEHLSTLPQIITLYLLVYTYTANKISFSNYSSSLVHVSAIHGHHQMTAHLDNISTLYFNELIPKLKYVNVVPFVISNKQCIFNHYLISSL
jgi:hypothetical protein